MSRLFSWLDSLAPLPRLTIWSLVLHGVWEIFQCLFFYDMSGFTPIMGALWMIGATLADVALSLLLVGGALWFHRCTLSVSFALALIFAGLLVAIGIESLASMGDWWRYAALMPQLKLVGVTLGLLPVLQIALLPYLGAKLARLNPWDH